MVEFQETVKQSKSKIGAIKAVRELLSEHFPEIKEIPEPEKTEQETSEVTPSVRRSGLIPAASNEFMIAKNIVDLLYGAESE